MLKWVNSISAPTVLLWLYAAASGVVSGVLEDIEVSGHADLASRAALPLILAFWVTEDARRRRHPLAYDYDSFVFFAWPVVVPVYLVRTRRWRALLTLLCFAGICLVGMMVALLTSFVRGNWP